MWKMKCRGEDAEEQKTIPQMRLARERERRPRKGAGSGPKPERVASPSLFVDLAPAQVLFRSDYFLPFSFLLFLPGKRHQHAIPHSPRRCR